MVQISCSTENGLTPSYVIHVDLFISSPTSSFIDDLYFSTILSKISILYTTPIRLQEIDLFIIVKHKTFCHFPLLIIEVLMDYCPYWLVSIRLLDCVILLASPYLPSFHSDVSCHSKLVIRSTSSIKWKELLTLKVVWSLSLIDFYD